MDYVEFWINECVEKPRSCGPIEAKEAARKIKSEHDEYTK